ncbi:hypothetical protein [Polyangium jinanense]|uniref:PLD phosphodiesterase domain-containing protein n=1 Tax=Polyangium jinanense TaxID=2829994 RepID=A0A9X3XED2_9BACT|nr:hypothetical protein [Polyangium jinanense]MDC3987493.1 hypothetical protein [Polyangium jinanense]
MKREIKLFDELDRFARGSEITHALGLSFGYDGDLANERLWKPLVEKYGLRHPLVIAGEVGRNVDEGTARWVTVLRAGRKRGVFHPKLVLAVREDAVFVALGSANLTKGGLGQNLELLTPLVFSQDAERPVPKGVLAGILEFLGDVVEGLPVADDSAARVRDVVTQARIVLEELPEAPRRGPDLRFVHSYQASIWGQVCVIHDDDAVEHVLVVSPFLETDADVADEADSLLRHALGGGLPWAARAVVPRMTLCTVLEPNKLAPLPRLALQELGAKVALRTQSFSEEERPLHGKIVVVFGRKRTTMLWGSPNFTNAALLRSVVQGGNVECALVLSAPAAGASMESVHEEFEIDRLFLRHRGALPPAYVAPPPPEVLFEVGEAIYDTRTRVLSVHGVIWSKKVHHIRVSIEAEGVVLHESGRLGVGTFSIPIEDAPLEEEDPETGKRRLRAVSLRIEARSADGRVLDTRIMRYNVRFEEALGIWNNLIIETEVFTADALLAQAATPEQRVAAVDAQIAAWKAARREEKSAPQQHQASLDQFFRQVRAGLDGHWRRLEARKMSRFALRWWSTKLCRSLDSASAGSIDGIRRTYFVARVAEHVARVVSAVADRHDDATAAFAALEPAKLAVALEGVPLASDARHDILDEVWSLRVRVVEMLQERA